MSEYEDEPDPDGPSATCGVCDAEISFSGKPWVALNRFFVWGGSAGRSVEVLEDDNEYLWSDTGERDGKSLAFYCWPDCLMIYIEGEMMDAKHVQAKDRGDPS